MSRWQKWKTLHIPTTTWSSTKDHITVSRPRCSECSAEACVWQRCRCRVYFARCKDHQPGAVANMRQAHVCKEAQLQIGATT